MSSIDFVTVNFKTLDLIEIVVESIKKYVKFPYNIYIVNNGDSNNEFDRLNNVFKKSPNINIIKGVRQLSNSSIPGLEKDIEDPWIHTKYDRRKVHLASYALAKGLTIGAKEGTGDYISFIQSDIVFLNEWVNDILPLLEDNIFVSYAWRYDIDQANLPQWSIMKRKTLNSDFLYEEGDLYPNIHYKDTFGLFSLWARKRNKDFYICKNSLNERELKKHHILDLPHGEQGWINDKPFIYHYGRGTSREPSLRKLWIEKTTEYMRAMDE